MFQTTNQFMFDQPHLSSASSPSRAHSTIPGLRTITMVAPCRTVAGSTKLGKRRRRRHRLQGGGGVHHTVGFGCEWSWIKHTFSMVIEV